MERPEDRETEVWATISAWAHANPVIETLDKRVENTILRVESDHIVVRSVRTGKEREVRRSDVLADWHILQRTGRLRNGEEKSWHGSIVAAFLARLPGVTYTLRPRTLWWRPSDHQ